MSVATDLKKIYQSVTLEEADRAPRKGEMRDMDTGS